MTNTQDLAHDLHLKRAAHTHTRGEIPLDAHMRPIINFGISPGV